MIEYLRIMIDAQRAKMDERGASAVEYGLLVAGIAALVVIAVFALGPIVREAFSRHLRRDPRGWRAERHGDLRQLTLTGCSLLH